MVPLFPPRPLPPPSPSSPTPQPPYQPMRPASRLLPPSMTWMRVPSPPPSPREPRPSPPRPSPPQPLASPYSFRDPASTHGGVGGGAGAGECSTVSCSAIIPLVVGPTLALAAVFCLWLAMRRCLRAPRDLSFVRRCVICLKFGDLVWSDSSLSQSTLVEVKTFF